MNNIRPPLPHEVSALIHHVELDRAGWSDKALSRLVIATLWLAEDSLNTADIRATLDISFGLPVAFEKLTRILDILKSKRTIVEISDGLYRIPNTMRTELETEIHEAEVAQTKASDYFRHLVTELTDLDPPNAWIMFERRFLLPMVRDIGANTYRLLIGEPAEIDGRRFNEFLSAFEPRNKQVLREVIALFLDPKKDAVRDYISRLLHAYFCVEATGISDSLSKKLDRISNRPQRFRLFLDTNFLFSFLGLHENPSNPSAKELHDLLTTLKQKDNPQVIMYVTPKTIEEAKTALVAAKVGVSEVPLSANFTDVALRVGISGLRQRYFLERMRHDTLLTADDWFNPYLNNFVRMSREAGVELYNEKLDRYSTRQDVVDDIEMVMTHERQTLSEDRRKTYEKVAHDTILWHLVNDQRPAYVETPLDARDWILTVDFRLIAFDSFKLRKRDSNFPLCLHPTSLIQMLQFWVPRTHEFEEAMLGAVRLPFLFQEFDAQAEQTSLAILGRLGRFSGSEDFSEDAVSM